MTTVKEILTNIILSFMKTYRFIGTVLLAVILCANFISCTKDDPEDNGYANEKKLTKISVVSDGIEMEKYTFSYSDDGKIRRTERIYNLTAIPDTIGYDFMWAENTVTVYGVPDYYLKGSVNTLVLSLENGLVKSEAVQNEETLIYAYNSSNRLASITESNKVQTTINWNNDKLLSFSNNNNFNNKGAFTYNGKSCKKGYFPFYADMMRIGKCPLLFVAHPELAGLRIKQLPATLQWVDQSSEQMPMTYKFDEEGYVTELFLSFDDSGTSYILTWK